jgi:hypothetical protein
MQNIRSFEALMDTANGAAPLVEIKQPDSERASLVAAWAYTRDVEKLWFLIRAAQSLGGPDAFAWSLNFSSDVRERAKAHPRWFFTTMQRHVRAQTPIVMAFGFDGDRLHCHGAAAAVDGDDAERIKRALLRAGGDWDHTHGRAHQLHTTTINDPDGWSQYLRRNISEAKSAGVVGPLWSATHVLRRQAKAIYEQVRADANQRAAGWATSKAPPSDFGNQATEPNA